MASGVGTGIGIGIGEAMQHIGDSLAAKYARERGDREKQAEVHHAKGLELAGKLLQAGYTTKAVDGQHQLVDAKTGQPATNAPFEINQTFNELLNTSKQATSLFPADQPNLIAQHFRKWLGKPLHTPTDDTRLSQYSPEALAAQAPQDKSLAEMNTIRQQIDATYPNASPSEKSAYFTQAMSKKLGTEPEKWAPTKLPPFAVGEETGRQPGVYHQVERTKDGKTQTATERMPGVPTTALTSKKISDQRHIPDPENPGKFVHRIRYADGTVEDEADTPPTGMMEKPAKPDTSPQGRLSKALKDSGKAATDEEANKQAAQMIVDAAKAKEKASSGVGGGLTLDEAKSLAQSDIILGHNTSFGLGKSQDRELYNRARAELMMGGQLGAALGQKADVKATTAAIGTMQKMRSTVGAFQKTLNLNLDQASQLSQQVGRTGSSLANEYALYLQGKIEDYPELQRFRVAVNTAANEYGRITNSATGGGVSTDSARGEALSLLNTALAEGAFQGAVQQMKVDAENRIKGMDETISGLGQQIQGSVTPGGGTSGTSVPSSLDEKLNKIFGPPPVKK